MTIERSSAGLIVLGKRLLCISNRAHGGYGCPGGKQEGDEPPKATCCRELAEEVGLLILPAFLSFVYEGKSDTGRLVSLFHVNRATGTPSAVEPGTDMRLFTLTELLTQSPFANFYARALPDGIYHLRDTLFMHPWSASQEVG